MTQFECSDCGQLGRFVDRNESFRMECPACGERTTWAVAFEAEPEGVDF